MKLHLNFSLANTFLIISHPKINLKVTIRIILEFLWPGCIVRNNNREKWKQQDCHLLMNNSIESIFSYQTSMYWTLSVDTLIAPCARPPDPMTKAPKTYKNIHNPASWRFITVHNLETGAVQQKNHPSRLYFCILSIVRKHTPALFLLATIYEYGWAILFQLSTLDTLCWLQIAMSHSCFIFHSLHLGETNQEGAAA